MGALSPVAKQQFFDNNGNLAVGFKLYTYTTNTTTPLATYTDAALTTPNANPIILDSRGECVIYLQDALYRYVLKDASDATIWTRDGIASPLYQGALGGTSPIIVANVAALNTLTGMSNDALATTLGYYTDNDGGHGTYRYDSTSTATVNGGTVINASGGVGRWLLLYNDHLNVRWFGAKGDGVTDDTASILAFCASATSGTTLLFDGSTYKKNGCVTITGSDICLHFSGTKFLEGDSGANGTTVNGSTGKIGWLFKQADNLSITGAVKFYGQGVLGTTSLLCVAFDNCPNTICDASMYFDRAAIGRMLMDCTNGRFSDAHAEYMDGKQTFESPPTNNAGSVEVVVGCSYVTSGDAVSINGEKPCRYMSVGTGKNNIGCSFGASILEHDSSSLTGHALTVRSAVSCYFGPVISKGGAYSALNVQTYAGDSAAGYAVDDVVIASIQGDTGPTGASVDALVYAESLDTVMTGLVSIGSVIGVCAGEYGIFNNGTRLRIGHCKLSGSATRLVAVFAQSAGFSPSLHIDKLEIANNTGAAEPVSVGKGGRITANVVEFLTGPTAAVPVAITYNAALGVGAFHNGVSIGSISYRRNSSANNYIYIVNLPATTLKDCAVWNADADEAATTAVSLGSDWFKVRNGQWFSDTIPVQTGVQVGTAVWKSNVVAGGSPGWVYVAASWRTMAAIS